MPARDGRTVWPPAAPAGQRTGIELSRDTTGFECRQREPTFRGQGGGSRKEGRVEHASNSNSTGAPAEAVSRLTVTVDIDWSGEADELEQAMRAAFGEAAQRVVVVDPDDRTPEEVPYFEFARLENSEGGPSHEGDVEVDDNAIVSMSDDGGAYVAAWIWVSDEDAGVTREEE